MDRSCRAAVGEPRPCFSPSVKPPAYLVAPAVAKGAVGDSGVRPSRFLLRGTDIPPGQREVVEFLDPGFLNF